MQKNAKKYHKNLQMCIFFRIFATAKLLIAGYQLDRK